jgi:hypothetical protein
MNSGLPLKNMRSVSTESALAPARSKVLAKATGLKPVLNIPAEGEAFFNSQIK